MCVCVYTQRNTDIGYGCVYACALKVFVTLKCTQQNSYEGMERVGSQSLSVAPAPGTYHYNPQKGKFRVVRTFGKETYCTLEHRFWTPRTTLVHRT